ncbi:MAG: hypothetical protein WCO60_07040 [Verrucomicrobiota bacterium]
MNITESKVTELLNWAYDKSVGKIAGLESAEELGEHYLRTAKDKEEAIESLIRWQAGKCAVSGFVTGLGGLLTLPIAIPSDLAVN